MKTQRASPRGYVLAFVLFTLLILTVLIAAMYQESTEIRESSMSSTFSQVAAVNAERGLQEAIRAMRSGAIVVTGINGTCIGGPNYRTDCAGGTYVELGGGPSPDGGYLIVNNGNAYTPWEGGGLQYYYVIFKSPIVNQPQARYTVQVTGYAGMSETAASLVTSVIEAEIEVGTDTFQCNNAYDCSG